MDTLIIAHRRKGHKMWEGYAVIDKADKNKEIFWRREKGLVCKTFPSITEYRADVTKKALSCI